MNKLTLFAPGEALPAAEIELSAEFAARLNTLLADITTSINGVEKRDGMLLMPHKWLLSGPDVKPVP